jgi:hypothetical protein
MRLAYYSVVDRTKPNLAALVSRLRAGTESWVEKIGDRIQRTNFRAQVPRKRSCSFHGHPACLDPPPSISQGPLGRTTEQSHRAQPSRAARSAQFSEGLRNLLQSSTNWHQRCRGTSLGGRSESSRATPSTQSIGSRGCGVVSCSWSSLCRGNCHSHRLRAPKPIRRDVMPRDF